MATRNVYYVDKYNNPRKDSVSFTWKRSGTMQSRAQNLQKAFLQKHPTYKPLDVSALSTDKKDKSKGGLYDYNYFKGLLKSPKDLKKVLNHNAFTDIRASKNADQTHAKSSTLFTSLYKKDGLAKLKDLVSHKSVFLNTENKLNHPVLQSGKPTQKVPSKAKSTESKALTHNKVKNVSANGPKVKSNRPSQKPIQQARRKSRSQVRHITPKPIDRRMSARMIYALQLSGQVPGQEISDAFKHNPKVTGLSLKDAQKLGMPTFNERLANGAFNNDNWLQALNAVKQNEQYAKNQPNPIHIVTVASKNYPQNLKHTVSKKYPPILYVQGNPAVLNQKSVAMIGSRGPWQRNARNPLPQSVNDLTRVYTKAFVKHGYAEIGGLARGTDSYAHEDAIKDGGHAIAVLPESLDQPVYPARNKGLAQSIINHGGALVSAKPLGTQPMLWKTKQQTWSSVNALTSRDPYQAKLADGTVAIDCADPSGTMHAMDTTVAERRPLGATDANNMTSVPNNQYFNGTARYIYEGKAEGISTWPDINRFIKQMDRHHELNVSRYLQNGQENRQQGRQVSTQQNHPKMSNNLENLVLTGAKVDKAHWDKYHIIAIAALIKRDHPSKNQSPYLTNVSGAKLSKGTKSLNKTFHGQWLMPYDFNRIRVASGGEPFSKQAFLKSIKTGMSLVAKPLRFQARTKPHNLFLDAQGRPSRVIAAESVRPPQQAKNAQKDNQQSKQNSHPQNQNDGDDFEM